MTPDSCLVCKKGKVDLLARCGHKYHKQCVLHSAIMKKGANCVLCGGPVSYVQQVEDLKSGKVTLETIFDKKSKIKFDEQALYWAVQNNDVDLVREIVSFGIIDFETDYYVALAAESKGGQLEMVEYLMNESGGWAKLEGLEGAISVGNVEIVKYMVEEGDLDCGSDTISSAVYSGNLEIVKYLVEEACLECDTEPLEVAAEKDHLDILTYLISKRAPCSDKVVYKAAKNGNVEIIEYLLSKKANFTASAIKIAASQGRHDIVQLLVEHASATGHLDVSEYKKYL